MFRDQYNELATYINIKSWCHLCYFLHVGISVYTAIPLEVEGDSHLFRKNAPTNSIQLNLEMNY